MSIKLGSAHAEETDGDQFHGATMDYRGSLVNRSSDRLTFNCQDVSN